MLILTVTLILLQLHIAFGNTETTTAASVEKGGKSVAKFFTIGTVDGKRYFAKKGYFNWTESNAECQNIGMELATITTVNELNFLHKAYNERTLSYGHWIAARDAKLPRALSWDKTGAEVKPLSDVKWKILVENYAICGRFDPKLPEFSLMRCEKPANILCQSVLKGSYLSATSFSSTRSP